MASLVDVYELYKNSKDFKDYVDKYTAKHRMHNDNVFGHKMVQEAYEYYYPRWLKGEK